ncbi:MAG: anti-sigma factor antagonist [Cytophagales bacterium]|nr:MAG: anti-sigma factor antagonist [Cytophagales bacterium]TAF61092.1 MAG: anti-sigma factor antagonist [Cytophagales bacterium]
MQVLTTTQDDFYLLTLEGDLDAVSAINLDDAIESALKSQNKHLLIDCINLNYISSPGIGVFTSRLEDCEKLKIKLITFGLSTKVLKVFQILGLDKLLTIVPTLTDAQKLIANAEH